MDGGKEEEGRASKGEGDTSWYASLQNFRCSILAWQCLHMPARSSPAPNNISLFLGGAGTKESLLWG